WLGRAGSGSVPLVGRPRQRQPDGEDRSLPDRAAERDGAAVLRHDRAGSGEADAVPSDRAALRVLSPREPIEDAGVVLGSDADALVAHLDERPPHSGLLRLRDRDLDLAAVGAVLHRVGDEVTHYP